MPQRTLFALLATIIFTSPAVADACDNATTQSHMNQCARLGFEQADSELNDTYKEVMAGYKALDARMKANNPKAEIAAPALVAAQRAWITLRDTECHLEGLGSQGGSIRPMIINQCLDRLTRERVTWLRKKLTCEEGDMACVQLGDGAD